jgi:hypothetical protein
MPGAIEDKRIAANTTVSLSSFLITVSLGIVAAEAVIVTFVLDKRQNLLWFSVSAGIGFIAVVASIYFGGLGITELLRKGFNGDWVWKTEAGYFNKQAILILIGIIGVAVSVFCGEPKMEKPVLTPEFYALQAELRGVERKLDDLTAKYELLSAPGKAKTPTTLGKNARPGKH